MPPARTVTLLGVPFDAASSFRRGAAGGPQAIRAALRSPAGNWWTERLVDLAAEGALVDAGDLDLSETTPAQARAGIEKGVAQVLDSGATPLVLGGDHSITYPVLRAVRRRHTRLSVLHVDAHPDVYDVFEGDRYSHACPFARVLEEGLTDRLVQVGIRALTGAQRIQLERFDVQVIDMRAWVVGQRPEIPGPVYISIDLDGLDPAHAPGVAHLEPGGLTTRDVIGLVQDLSGPVVGADVVELNPELDVRGVTAAAAAKLVKELADRMCALGGGDG
jgi:agmatinase